MATRRLFWKFFPLVLAPLLVAGIALLLRSRDAIDPSLPAWLAGGAVLVLASAGATALVCRRIERPLNEIHAGAERFAEGRLTPPIALSHPDDDDGGLAGTLNRMAAELSDRIQTINLQRNEQEAILSSMMEGVLAVDAEERLISLNAVAAHLFGVAASAVRGRMLQEVVRIPAMQEFVARTLASDAPQEGEFTQDQAGELRHLQVHGAALRDTNARRLGAVIVINDITRVRRLEGLQREFVANVSHELKTPITSIKGFIETLQDGAMNNREDAERFLAIVAKHADRLSAIIEDLLLLSRIDQDAISATLERDAAALKPVLEEAATACALKAQEKRVAVQVQCPDSLAASINRRMFTQVLINLIDNAVKYSDAGKTVDITALQADGEIRIQVRDHGCGIDPEHLPRLGERFYRVDKARSRTQGGTGLGLAIAQHILRAHGGRLTVASTVGEGSTFTVHLPAGSHVS